MSKEHRDEKPETSTASNGTKSKKDRSLVEQRAYELYLARGGGDGQAIEDWLIAETELRGRGEADSEES
jgi:hypothetical protein